MFRYAAPLVERSLRSSLVLSGMMPLAGVRTLWKDYLPQAAFFSCAPKTFIATIIAHVVWCGDVFLDRYPGSSPRSLTYPRRNAWSPSKHSRNRCPVVTVFSPREHPSGPAWRRDSAQSVWSSAPWHDVAPYGCSELWEQRQPALWGAAGDDR